MDTCRNFKQSLRKNSALYIYIYIYLVDDLRDSDRKLIYWEFSFGWNFLFEVTTN
jgi:hypothetical protein